MSSDIFEVDPLQLYFGDDYIINDKIELNRQKLEIL